MNSQSRLVYSVFFVTSWIVPKFFIWLNKEYENNDKTGTVILIGKYSSSTSILVILQTASQLIIWLNKEHKNTDMTSPKILTSVVKCMGFTDSKE